MRTFTSFDEVTAAAGEELGSSDWITIEQDRVDQFADATGDHQWIHVDAERAAEGPFGGTIAHGYLTLSLLPWLGSQLFTLGTPGAKLNYGCDSVRFTNPVPVGSRVRATATFEGVKQLEKGVQITTKYVVEIEGVERPALVAKQITLVLG